MEAHNSKTRLGTSEVPLVVKFADAKRKEPAPHHVSLSSFPKWGTSPGLRAELLLSSDGSTLSLSTRCLPTV